MDIRGSLTRRVVSSEALMKDCNIHCIVLGMWLGFSLFSILSGLEDKFERFLIRRAHALKKTPAPVRFNSTKQRINDHKPRGTFEKRVTVKDLDTTLIGSGGSSQY